MKQITDGGHHDFLAVRFAEMDGDEDERDKVCQIALVVAAKSGYPAKRMLSFLKNLGFTRDEISRAVDVIYKEL